MAGSQIVCLNKFSTKKTLPNLKLEVVPAADRVLVSEKIYIIEFQMFVEGRVDQSFSIFDISVLFNINFRSRF